MIEIRRKQEAMREVASRRPEVARIEAAIAEMVAQRCQADAEVTRLEALVAQARQDRDLAWVRSRELADKIGVGLVVLKQTEPSAVHVVRERLGMSKREYQTFMIHGRRVWNARAASEPKGLPRSCGQGRYAPRGEAAKHKGAVAC